jgi:HEAT repeat protein
VDVEQDQMNYRDCGDWRAAGLCAFARADPAGVLARVEARGWDAGRIAWCLGAVPDPRFLPYVITGLQSPGSIERVAAVNHLASHRDPRATEALLAALKDRSSFVRFCALEALGLAGDPRAVHPLRRFAKEVVASKRDVYLADAARNAIERIRNRRPR